MKARNGSPARQLDLDHVGAQVGQQHAGRRAGDEGAVLDDAHALQDLGHCLHSVGMVFSARRPAIRRRNAARAWPGTTAQSRSAGPSPRSGGAIRPAVRARIGTPLSASTGKPTPSSTAGMAPDTLSRRSLAGEPGHHLLDRLGDGDEAQVVPASRATSNSAPTRGSRCLVQRVAVAGNRLLGAHASRARPRQPHLERIDLSRGQPIDAHVQPSGRLRRAEDHRAAAEDAGRDRALHRVGRGGEGHARGLHAGHQAVLGDRHQRRIEHTAGLRPGRCPVTSRKK